MLRKVCSRLDLSRALLTLSALVLLGAHQGCATKPLAVGIEPSGRRIVLLLDSSTSMRKNDPDGAAQLGAQLIMGLAGSEDNVGALTYSASADVALPMRPAGGAERRGELARALGEVERNGITNFAKALDEAREMLDESKAPPGSAIVLLTDGVPYRGRRREVGISLASVVSTLIEKQWRIFAIALSKEAQSPFLSLLVGKTGGAVVPVANAGGLLDAFQEVAVEALGYLRAERGGSDVRLIPRTRRLAFVAKAAEGGGSLVGVRHDGAPLDGGAWIRTAARGYQVGLVEAPEPGRWQPELDGSPEVVALVEPRFALEFLPGQPPEQLVSRAVAEVGVRLIGAADVLAEVAPRLKVRAQMVLNEKPRGRQFKLSPTPEDPTRFVAKFRTPRVTAEGTLRMVVEAELTEQGKPFVLRRSRSLTVQPGDGTSTLQVRVTPSEVSLTGWKGVPLEPVTFRVEGDPEQPVTVTCGRKRLELEAGAQGTLAPPLRRPMSFTAEGVDGSTWKQTVRVIYRAFKLQGAHAKGIDLAPVPAGSTSEPLALELSAAPEAALSFDVARLRGPGGATLEATVTDGRLAVAPAANLPPGDYEGRLPVRGEGVRGSLEIPVRVEVLAPFQAPDDVNVQASWGWASQPVEVAWPAAQPVPVRITAGALVGSGSAEGARIGPKLDIRIRPLDGWSGDQLGVSPRRFALEVYVSSDLPAGDYAGEVEIAAEGSERAPLVIPIRLGVRR
jgi:hypothetical protein